jgi:hypothetical protein
MALSAKAIFSALISSRNAVSRCSGSLCCRAASSASASLFHRYSVRQYTFNSRLSATTLSQFFIFSTAAALNSALCRRARFWFATRFSVA